MDFFEDVRHLEPFMACDIFELLILSGEYEEMSRADMRDYIRDAGVEDKDLRRRAGLILQVGSPDEDTVNLLMNAYLLHLKARQRLMKGFYPFSVDDNIIQLNDSVDARCYHLLLHCSRLDTVTDKKLSEAAAMAFEEVAAQVARLKLGADFRVHGMGTHANNSQYIFSSKKDKSIIRLARWFGERVDPEFLKDAQGASGDHGIDLVGKLKIDHLAYGSPAFLGQCAASSDEKYWKRKKYDTDKVTEVIKFLCDPVRALFVPCFYRKTDGQWHNITALSKAVVFDRMRLAAANGDNFVFRHDDILGDLKSSFLSLQ